MVRKKERLTRIEFSRFFSSGKRQHTNSFQVVVVEHPTFHASVVVSKKILSKATDRNKLRRRVYAILRQTTQKHGVFIVIAKKPSATLTYTKIKQEIEAVIGATQKTY